MQQLAATASWLQPEALRQLDEQPVAQSVAQAPLAPVMSLTTTWYWKLPVTPGAHVRDPPMKLLVLNEPGELIITVVHRVHVALALMQLTQYSQTTTVRGAMPQPEVRLTVASPLSVAPDPQLVAGQLPPPQSALSTLMLSVALPVHVVQSAEQWCGPGVVRHPVIVVPHSPSP